MSDESDSESESEDSEEEMTEARAFAGFPLHPRIRTALVEFMGPATRRPKGIAQQTIGNLLQRNWVSQGVDEGNYPIYSTTREGITAFEIDKIAVTKLGKHSEGRTMAHSGVYKDLWIRLRFLQAMQKK
jgi:hypothetical protein